MVLLLHVNYCAAFDDVSVNSAQVCAELSSYLSLYPDLVALVGKVLAALAREGNKSRPSYRL